MNLNMWTTSKTDIWIVLLNFKFQGIYQFRATCMLYNFTNLHVHCIKKY